MAEQGEESNRPSVRPSVPPPAPASFCPSVHPPFPLSVHPSLHPSHCLSVQLSQSACPSVSLPILSVRPSLTHPSTPPLPCPFFPHPSLRPSLCPLILPSVRLSVPLQILAQTWPFFGRYMEKLLVESIAPSIRASNTHLQTFTFTRVDMGEKVPPPQSPPGGRPTPTLRPTLCAPPSSLLSPQPLRVLGVRAHPGTHKQQILLDLNIR